MATIKFRSEWFNSISDRESYWVLVSFIGKNFASQFQAKVDIRMRGKILDQVINSLQVNNVMLTDDEKRKFCADTMGSCRQALLLDEEFAWLDINNERMCYWAWLYVNKFPPITNPVMPNQQATSYTTGWFAQFQHMPDYGATAGVAIPTDTAERIKEVIHKFDFEFQCDVGNKKQYLEDMKTRWAACFQFQKMHNWINPSNEIQINWAWEHLPRHIFANCQQPTNLNEQYLAIVGALDTWNDHPAALSLIIDKAKRAWSQKKHRDKRGDKKAYSFVISDEAKHKLDSIARITDRKLNETIEKMIYNEVERLKASGIHLDEV